MTIGKNQAPYKAFAKLFCTYSPREKLVRLGRIVWAKGTPGRPGGGYSAKLSLGLCPRLLSFKRDWNEWCASFLGVRVHYQRSYGGWMASLILAFALLGCTVSTAQTSYDQQQDERIRALELLHGIGTTTGGTTTGGSTTGGTTTGGTTTGGSTTGGTTGGTTTGGEPSDRRVIFAATHETGPTKLGGWEVREQAAYNSGGGTQAIVEVSNAKSGRYVLRQWLNGQQKGGARVFALHDWSSGSAKPLPYETWTTFYLRIPQRYTFSYCLLAGWKQNSGGNKAYNEPTVTLEWGGSTDYLRANIKGRTAGTGEPQNYYQYGPNPKDPNQKNVVKFPVGQWVKLEMYVLHSTDSSSSSPGRFIVWQDGQVIISYAGQTLRTKVPRATSAPYVEMELTNYGESYLRTSFDFDDVLIETPK